MCAKIPCSCTLINLHFNKKFLFSYFEILDLGVKVGFWMVTTENMGIILMYLLTLGHVKGHLFCPECFCGSGTCPNYFPITGEVDASGFSPGRGCFCGTVRIMILISIERDSFPTSRCLGPKWETQQQWQGLHGSLEVGLLRKRTILQALVFLGREERTNLYNFLAAAAPFYSLTGTV